MARPPRIDEIVAESLKYRDGKEYDLISYSIMSNHAHTVFTPLLNGLSITEVRDGDQRRFISDKPPVPVIMKSLKGYTAYKANRLLNRTGAFWEEESYDHEIDTPADLGRIVNCSIIRLRLGSSVTGRNGSGIIVKSRTDC